MLALQTLFLLVSIKTLTCYSLVNRDPTLFFLLLLSQVTAMLFNITDL